MNKVTVGELKGMLDECADHLFVIIEIDPEDTNEDEETIFDVTDVTVVNLGGERLVRIDWA